MEINGTPEPWIDPLDRYRDFSIASGRTARTIELRLYQLNRFARSHPGGPASVRPQDALKYLARPDWSLNTRAVVHRSLRSFYGWALDTRILGSDPTTSLPAVKPPVSTPRAVPRRVIRDAIKAATPRVALMIQLSSDAGLSAMEIASARVRDVQEVDGDYAIRTRGRAGTVRLVPLPPALGEQLRLRDGDYLFPGRDGEPMGPAYIVRLISRALPGDYTSETLRLNFESAGNAVRLATWRDGSHHSAAEPALLDAPELAEAKNLQRHFRRIEQFMESDPGTAISECKNVIEGLTKLILTDLGQLPVGQPTMPSLNQAVVAALDLEASSAPGNTRGSKRIATLISNTFRSISDLRNDFGTGHGVVGDHAPEAQHARLVFNATVTVAEYLVARWRDMRPD